MLRWELLAHTFINLGSNTNGNDCILLICLMSGKKNGSHRRNCDFEETAKQREHADIV